MIEDESAPRPTRLVYPDPPRLKRIRLLSQFLDQSILLPGGYRIGFDPIIGLVPGVGDLIASAFSCYMVLEAYQLGLPKRIILKMLGNIAVETMVGAAPIVGDIFDAVWKANIRNLRLVELAYHPNLKERAAWKLAIGLVLGLFAIWAASISVVLLIARFILSWF